MPTGLLIFTPFLKKFVGYGTGYDNISMDIIHQSLQNIVQPLVSIMNLSLSTGVFPGSLKISKVIPVFKAHDPTLFSTYRPI